jgi:hypothetical protein
MKYLYCPDCKTDHQSNEIELIDIEEDFQGRDLVTFICPNSSRKLKAYPQVSNWDIGANLSYWQD